MIVIVEDVLTQIIEDGLKGLKNRPDIVDKIFSKTNVTTRARLKEFLAQGKIKVLRGYPHDRAQLPSYVIMLGGEREQEKNIGGYIDDSYDVADFSEDIIIKKSKGKLIVEVTKKPLEYIHDITFGGVPVSFEVLDSNRGIVEIHNDGVVEVGDEVSVSYSHASSGSEEFGSLFYVQYRVETWTNNGDLTVIMYHLLKWIILSSRNKLESVFGLDLQTVGGLDFEASPEYLPEFVYRRALTFECAVENSYEEAFDFIQGIEVNETLSEGE